MNSQLNLRRPSFFEIYADYREIVSHMRSDTSKERMVTLSKSLETAFCTTEALFSNLHKLMLQLDLSVDSQQFSCFYNFAFFVCREKGQKNITVERAIRAWRLVLAGRFRLLNHWCTFVEKNQRHNISEDTWQQLLSFSRCVNEDLDGYDPKGAWPVLIDDFVEHMYRIGNSCCSSLDLCCNCEETEVPSSISYTLRGLKLLPGSKRKSISIYEHQDETSYLGIMSPQSPAKQGKYRETSYKRSRENAVRNVNTGVACNHVDMININSLSCLSKEFEENSPYTKFLPCRNEKSRSDA